MPYPHNFVAMNFKIDENLPIEVARLLQQKGHNAVTVGEQKLNGKPDTIIASVCQDEGRILITLDTDFADIRVYPPKAFSGIIVLRLQHLDKKSVVNTIQSLTSILETETINGCLWVVDERRIRIRE